MKKNIEGLLILIFILFVGCAITSNITQQKSKIPEEDIFYYEDFSNVETGLIPKNWIGGSSLSVNDSDHLSNFEKRKWSNPHSFSIPDINFPENFTIEISITVKTKLKPMKFDIGNLNIILNPFALQKSYLGNSNFIFPKLHKNNYTEKQWSDIMWNAKSPYLNQWFTMKLTKEGPVFKIFIDDEKCSIIRFPNFQHNSSINFEFEGGFAIKKVIGYISE